MVNYKFRDWLYLWLEVGGRWAAEVARHAEGIKSSLGLLKIFSSRFLAKITFLEHFLTKTLTRRLTTKKPSRNVTF